jgi:uncharacterized ParB-like nuclease family protein
VELGGPAHARERGGILVHVDREGRPVYNGWSGCHRLAIARHLALPTVPVSVGVVHADAVRSWRDGLRAPTGG